MLGQTVLTTSTWGTGLWLPYIQSLLIEQKTNKGVRSKWAYFEYWLPVVRIHTKFIIYLTYL